MKYEENIALRYLQTLNFKSIVYEPKRNKPPDFLLDSKIAVEVRRLNQYTFVKEQNNPIEKLEYNLIPKINNLLKDFETENYEQSIIVFVSYKRPLKIDRKLINRIKIIIKENIELTVPEKKVDINDNLEISFLKTEVKLDKSIFLGLALDYDSGGFVISNIYKSLQLIIKEKEDKIEKYFKDFDTWWLVLIDYIGYGLNELDLYQLNRLPKLQSFFHRILIVSPLNIKNIKELDYEFAGA